MTRLTTNFILDNPVEFKRQVLTWADGNYDTVCYLDNNLYQDYSYHTFEGLIAVGAKDSLELNFGNAFDRLKEFLNQKKDWLFGFFGYDLKNELESLSSKNDDGLNFPDLFFFQPEWVIEIHKNHALVHAGSKASFPSLKSNKDYATPPFSLSPRMELQPRISKPDYLKAFAKIHTHITRGDIYEMNFCQEFFAENASLNPLAVFLCLNELSHAPFSCYLKYGGKYLISASPERFLKKKGSKLISMPIKGTARRGMNAADDEAIRQKLSNDRKERSENVMIVDLMRNDLSKSCAAGSVRVEELFSVKTFPQVHQLVSTVTGTLCNDVHFVDAIKNAFPMGSMTGAPKVKAMELIEQFEKSKRGLYSGAAGYFTPEGDFDFNVVIRSLLYNSNNRFVSFHVGSAIVFDSVPEKEYEECLLKAKALRQALYLAQQPETAINP
ncbi:MAG TPA: aminodeoxychorismate synthase component I [Chitinophagales bacterium]|nr:aminodeoxychorismate synthase component I [Chitinophagales bacterium]